MMKGKLKMNLFRWSCIFVNDKLWGKILTEIFEFCKIIIKSFSPKDSLLYHHLRKYKAKILDCML